MTAIGAVLLVAAIVLLVTRLEGGAEPRRSVPGARVLPAAAVVSAPRRYLGERVAVRGRVVRSGEAGFVLVDGGTSLVVLGPTGGPFPHVRRGELVRVRGAFRALEAREARRLAGDSLLPAESSGRAIVATSVDSFVAPSRPGERVRP